MIDVHTLYAMAEAYVPFDEPETSLFDADCLISIHGENWVNVAGFFEALTEFMRIAGDDNAYCLDFEARRQAVLISITDTFQQYLQRRESVPGMDEAPFISTTLFQVIIAESGKWAIAAHRDSEKMVLMFKDIPSQTVMAQAIALVVYI
jgi:hypothetical protein